MRKFICKLKELWYGTTNTDITKKLQSIQESIQRLYVKVDDYSNGMNHSKQDLSFSLESSATESLIRLYTQNALRQNDLSSSKEILAVQSYVKIELENLGIKFITSLPGTSFDSMSMITAQCEYVMTNKKELENHVAKSVVPAFYWQIDNSHKQLLHKEQVVLYQYSELPASSQNLLQDVAPISNDAETVIGYLVVEQYDKISAIHEIYEGCNVYGSAPKQQKNVHSHQVVVTDGMEDEHFEIANNVVRLLAGSWGIGYLENNKEKQIEIYNGLKIILNDHLYFIIIEK